MKFVESIEKPVTNNKKEFSYNRTGDLLAKSSEKTFARSIEIGLENGGVQERYFITVHNNSPYDPHGIDSHRETNLRTQLKPVSKQTFDYYVLYLQTRNLLYMTRTNRSFLNG